jgi:dipeptidyl aminopeptidase/acylaminoacyl peptidase
MGAALCALAASVSLVALTSSAQARTPDFTIEQALSAPFPSSMTAASTGGRIAWVYNKDGVRNVWVAEPGAGGYTAHAITSYAGDDGADMGELAWGAKGDQVYYIRGGSLEGGGPVNIMSRVDGPPPQQIWAASISGGEPHLVGAGNTPTPSPRGDVVAYLSGGQIWLAPAAGDGKPQMIQARGRGESLVWSPDGSRLAFVSGRGDHSLIGVYDMAAKTISWMSPSVDGDRDPQWSPDGKRIAFIRIPTTGAFDFRAKRESDPWSIRVADVSTGEARVVWTASKGSGSVFNSLLSGPNLMWGAGDRIAFPWERDGWTRLYSVSANGGQAQLLTPGDAEVWNVAVTPDHSRVVYSSNLGDIDRRHLWEVPIAGGQAKPLTEGLSVEDYPVVGSDGHVVGLHSDGKNPMRPVSVDAGHMRDLAPAAMPADFPASKMVDPRQVIFTAADGMQVHAQLFLPPAGAPNRGPALLFFHGGPVRQMLLGWHPMDAYAFMYGMNEYLANEGYVVLSVNYRGGIGYGLNFREAENFGPGGASELNDIIGAALYLRSRPDVDPKRIGIWGGSYGGLMTALGLAREPDLLAAGVDYAGVHDWRAMLSSLPGFGMNSPAAQTAFDSSAMATIERWRAPVLVVHADDDRNVPFDQSVELVKALRKQGVEPEQVIIPDEIHDLLRHNSWLTLFGSADDFFKRKLMDETPKR